MSRFDEIDFYTDASLLNDPYPYFEHLRAHGPAVRLPARNVVAVTGYEEGLAIFRDDERYSAINSVGGPFPPLPFTPDGDDITPQLDAYRGQMAFGGLIVSEDPPQHGKTKSLLMGMITPARLRDNQEFMWRLAEQQIDEFIDRGECDLIADYGYPFATLVIADLLGVPKEDHEVFRTLIGSTPGQLGGVDDPLHNPLARIAGYFMNYVEDRRRAPRSDVLTDLSRAKYADGSLPPLMDVVAVATFLFGAGQDTTVRLFGAMLRFLAEDQELQSRLRADRSLIPAFVEESLRLEGTVKSDHRLTKVPVKIGDLEIAPGTNIMLLISAMNRDPRRFENPYELRLDRKNLHEHLAFGRGIHSCAGAPLARAEAKITLEKLFDRTSSIRINEEKHGPAGARRFEYIPSYTLRGLSELHLEFTKA